ncbi:hypothetical protein GCM10019016_010900 [Streptomyces prasinosporus]|uniref:Uncharacterized protein n=1 Tax=Streptomyces prasinosporus TaxID=68256 RepID=A0ABP6TI08_9ACTN|nr:hypothetical protein GCM10010332_73410 [Streptomyces albogriseolus]
MPATLVDEPLGLDCVFSDGRRAKPSLDGLSNPQLARDLAIGLAELVHPHGTVDAAGSMQHYTSAARHMVRTLAGRGFSGGLGQLSRGMLAEYWMGASRGREALTRTWSWVSPRPEGRSCREWRISRTAGTTTRSPTASPCRPTTRPSGTGSPASAAR